ncbi:MAG: ABC transporter substrate-binding protein [Acidimicrobiales bacterium]
MPRPIRLAGSLAVLMALTLTATGCGSSPNTSAKVPLVLYAAEGYDMAMGTAFQAATGIQVKVDDDSTGPLITKIEAEKNNPQWDLFWADGDQEFATFDTQNILLKNWEPTVSYNSLGTSLLPQDKSYVPTGVTMACALVYDTQTVSNPPTSWSALASSQYNGELGMNDPSVSGPTYPCVAGNMQRLGGVSQGEAYYTQLKQNGLHVYQTNTNTLQALQTGQIKLATIQSSAGIGAGLKTSAAIKVAYLNPETVLPSVIGIDAKASSKAISEAKQFIQYVLSTTGQQVMQTGDQYGDSLYWPLINPNLRRL